MNTDTFIADLQQYRNFLITTSSSPSLPSAHRRRALSLARCINAEIERFQSFIRQLDELQARRLAALHGQLYLIPHRSGSEPLRPRHQVVTISEFTASGAAIISNNGVIRYVSRYRPVSTTLSTVESELVIHQ